MGGVNFCRMKSVIKLCGLSSSRTGGGDVPANGALFVAANAATRTNFSVAVGAR